jgi:hypothetical protein
MGYERSGSAAIVITAWPVTCEVIKYFCSFQEKQIVTRALLVTVTATHTDISAPCSTQTCVHSIRVSDLSKPPSIAWSQQKIHCKWHT